MALSMETEFYLLSLQLPSTPEYISLAERVPLLLKICLSLVCQLQLQSPHMITVFVGGLCLQKTF